jgi:3-deoxy-manno-octulosonate cytidylyltransferase (CMP-KDO synthetase)
VLEAFIATPQALVLIPARYASTRFPGKPLTMLAGKSMIERVYSQCVQAHEFSKNSFDLDVAVVTDDARIESHVKDFGGLVVRVDDDVPSGTQRVALAWERFFSKKSYNFIVNVQGDEPLYTGEDLKKLIDFHTNSSFDITTMLHRRSDEEGFNNPNRVKVVWNEQSGKCFYFSRAGIPYKREKVNEDWLLHVGVYSYKPEALKKFVGSEPSYYERVECLEQLRALELELTIGATKIDHELIGVDTPEDKERVEGVLL